MKPWPEYANPFKSMRIRWRINLGSGGMRSIVRLKRFFLLLCDVSLGLTTAAAVLRVIRALLPVLTLYVGKLVIDQVVVQSRVPISSVADVPYLLQSRHLAPLFMLIILEFGVALVSELTARGTALVDTLLLNGYRKYAGRKLIEQAALLELADFESSDFQDHLRRARYQVEDRSNAITQCFSVVQLALTAATLVIGLVSYSPFLLILISLALLPAFLAEARFNTNEYNLNASMSSERRLISYLFQIALGVEAAKEVKLFGLHRFCSSQFDVVASRQYFATRKVVIRRALYGTLFAGVSYCAYYVAYTGIIFTTLSGRFSIGDLTFMGGSLLLLRGTVEKLLFATSQIIDEAQYIGDLFAILDWCPTLTERRCVRPFPAQIRCGVDFR
jgi:ATP-binding cassette, subfamily B, bacterial